MLVVVAKRASMFDEQSSKCLANNACPFGRGLRIWNKLYVTVIECDSDRMDTPF